jgi:hypothetical protein
MQNCTAVTFILKLPADEQIHKNQDGKSIRNTRNIPGTKGHHHD